MTNAPKRSTARENKVVAPTRVGDASDEAGLSTSTIQSQAPTLLQDSCHRTVEIDRNFSASARFPKHQITLDAPENSHRSWAMNKTWTQIYSSPVGKTPASHLAALAHPGQTPPPSLHSALGQKSSL